jgi:hypothetical protein
LDPQRKTPGKPAGTGGVKFEVIGSAEVDPVVADNLKLST